DAVPPAVAAVEDDPIPVDPANRQVAQASRNTHPARIGSATHDDRVACMRLGDRLSETAGVIGDADDRLVMVSTAGGERNRRQRRGRSPATAGGRIAPRAISECGRTRTKKRPIKPWASRVQFTARFGPGEGPLAG